MDEDDLLEGSDFLSEKQEKIDGKEKKKKVDNRFTEKDVNRITSLSDPDDMMFEIISILRDQVVIPDPGNYYTFIYKASTPRIEYDQFPLIACVGIFRWGFRGLNYHWGNFRNYTWEEVIGYLHPVNDLELKTLRSIPYQNFTINN